MQMLNRMGKPSLYVMAFTVCRTEWYQAAGIIGATVLGYLGSKEQAAASDRANAMSYLNSKEGRQFQKHENVLNRQANQLQLALGQANNDTQRADTQAMLAATVAKQQRAYDNWTKEFGDVQDNLNSYYKNLSKDTVAGKAYNNLQSEYSNVMMRFQNTMAERGISPKSGFYNAGELTLDMQKASESAKIDQASEQYVREQQNQYIQDQANNPFISGRAQDVNFKSKETLLNDATSSNTKELYNTLKAKYANGEITDEEFKTQMVNKGGTGGSSYYDYYGTGGAAAEAGNASAVDCKAKNKAAAPGVAGVSASMVDGKCVETPIPALPTQRSFSGSGDGGLNIGGGYAMEGSPDMSNSFTGSVSSYDIGGTQSGDISNDWGSSFGSMDGDSEDGY